MLCLAGLVMINPFPPDSMSTAADVLDSFERPIPPSFSSSSSFHWRQHYQIDIHHYDLNLGSYLQTTPPASSSTHPPPPYALLREIATNATQGVRLEPSKLLHRRGRHCISFHQCLLCAVGAVPMRVVCTQKDHLLTGDRLDSLLRFHGMTSEENLRTLEDCASRVPMLTHLEQIDNAIFDFIDNID